MIWRVLRPFTHLTGCLYASPITMITGDLVFVRGIIKHEFHHINFVSEDVDRLHDLYTQGLGLDDIPIQLFPKPDATSSSGYDGKIRVATDGKM